MKRKTTRALLCLMTLAAALCLLPVGAAADMWLNNYGYPYGKDMNGSGQMTLVISVGTDETAPPTYQWEVADSPNGDFEPINHDDARKEEYKFNAQTAGSRKWYRCKINGDRIVSQPVMVVQATRGAGTENDWIWTNHHRSGQPDTRWYISNGTMAYWVNGSRFNVMGLYQNQAGQYYMLQTSYNGYWTIFSGNEPASGVYALEYLKLSFSDNSRGILFDAKLSTGENSMYIKADTQLGDYDLLGEAADKAVLKAQLGDGDRLDRITLMGVKDFSKANGDTPALAITPDASTPSSSFWIGQYSNSKGYKFNIQEKSDQYSTKTVGGQKNVVTLVQKTDTEMTLSWQDVTDRIVKFKFGIGTMNELDTVQCSISYAEEKLTGLLPNTEYRIEVRGKTDLPKYSIVADEDGKISLASTDKNNNAYSFFGEHLEIGRKDSTDITKEIVIPARPTAVLPANITATQSTVSFTSASGQIYEYSVNNNGTWQQLSIGADGKCTIPGLQPGDTVEIKTQKVATDSSFASEWTAPAEFVVSQSGTEFEALSVNGAGTSAEIAYGEPVTVTAKPKATGQAASGAAYGLLRRNAPTQRQMALFIGDRQISGAVDADAASGVYTMTLDTKGKMLDVGVNSVEVRYMGDTNMADAAGRVTITLLQRPLTIAGVTAEERTYDPASRTVRITGATLAGKALETDDVALDLTGLVGTLAGEGAGEYDKLILPDALSLTGEHAAYYTVAGGQVRAAVRIGRAPLDLRVRIADWTVGDAPAEPTITGNLGGGAVRYAYKPRSAGDSEYSAEVPALAGSYTVRASVAQTANYLGAEATADFSILPKPAAMPETGDGSRLSLWLALCLLAGAGTLALLRRRAEP